jgi:hypothetical protein
MLGADPELFVIDKEGKIIGSEKIIPKEVKFRNYHNNVATLGHGTSGEIVQDGIQLELHPAPSACRANLGNEISTCFRALVPILKEKGYDLSFLPNGRIARKELDQLGEDAKKFGCKPSYNTYTQQESQIQEVDASKHLQRSCGGHIHIGMDNGGWTNDETEDLKDLRENPDRYIRILDIWVGNTCVLVDRDKGNATRRKLYGLAGDVRFPKYGLEYRTLSNFWLQHYVLFSFVTGLCRQAYCIARSKPHAEELLTMVKTKDIQTAINKNNFFLALQNFWKIRPFIDKYFDKEAYSYPITTHNINEFLHFVYKGKDAYFTKNPIEHWIKLQECHSEDGWERFCEKVLKPEVQRVSTKS